ncbi:MAG TPA: hypothetical protein VKX49_30270 [Bryobacteraceae bacterium]|nr:hypothetical protein [Bryobacteraceae bacterium]
MSRIERRAFIKGIGTAVTLAPGIRLQAAKTDGRAHAALTRVNRKLLPTAAEVHSWHAIKDSKGGPTLTGSPSWHNYLEMLEKEWRTMGVTDIFRNPIRYTRWYTTEFPDDSNWSLHVNGKKIRVANYGCNSGQTPENGVTGELVVYKAGMPDEALRGKIAVIVKEPSPGLSRGSDDYEYLSNANTFPNPLKPYDDEKALSPFPIMGLGAAQEPLIRAGAAGAVIVMSLPFDAVKGLYTFGVPALHQMPTLYLDRDTGAEVAAAAASSTNAGKQATLRLIAKTEQAEGYQLFGYLPGRDYNTPEDKQILLITHTDGPSISQENGAIGILSIVKYFSRIPKEERPRSLMLFYDCRHFMPGMERAFANEDYAASHPDVYSKVIASIGIEHLGQMKVEEGGGKPFHRTNVPDLTTVYTTNNRHIVDLAVAAVKDSNVPRTQVQCPGRKGIHGGEQGPWYGLGSIANRNHIPGAACIGALTGYWTSVARLDWLDVNLFLTQMASMCQLCGDLMLADLESIKWAPAGPAFGGQGPTRS